MASSNKTDNERRAGSARLRQSKIPLPPFRRASPNDEFSAGNDSF
jgi:hypothetical protein